MLRESNRSRWAMLAVVLLVAVSPAAAQTEPGAAGEPQVVRIGVVADGDGRLRQETFEVFRSEVLALTAEELGTSFPPDKQFFCDWDLDRIASSLDALLADPEVDLVIAIGLLSSNAAAQEPSLPKPVVATMIVDEGLQQVGPYRPGGPESNLAYLNAHVDVARDVRTFREIVPFDRLTVLINSRVAEGIPGMVAEKSPTVEEIGVPFRIVEVDGGPEEILARLVPEDQAVYVAPLLQLSHEELAELARGLIERRLPSFSLRGRHEVEQGLLASLSPEEDTRRLARRIALNVQRILLGEEPASLPRRATTGERLTINMATARAIGVWPRFEVLTEAELLHPLEEAAGRTLDLESVMREAEVANLDLLAEGRRVTVGEEDVVQARSVLLPQVGVALRGTAVDSDLAFSNSGSRRSARASATLSYLLYSDAARGNYEVRQDLQRALEHDYDSAVLDVVLEAGLGYLDVRLAETLLRIQRDDLELTRRNLELAGIREEVGYSGPAEVYRWRSRIATAKQAVIDAEAQLNLARVELNRVRNRPLEEAFETEELGIDSAGFEIEANGLEGAVDNPWGFAVLRDFMVREGVEASPELASLGAAIEAQERALSIAERAPKRPTVALQANAGQVVGESGPVAGLPVTDDTDWTVAVQGQLDLYTGGGLRSAIRQAREGLIRLRLLRSATELRVEQEIRSTLLRAGASYAAIRLTREAADAARSNLDLVTDAYSRGVVSITELLDAQNAFLTADLGAAGAVYQALQDQLRVQRAASRFAALVGEEDRAAWVRRVRSYFAGFGGIPERN